MEDEIANRPRERLMAGFLGRCAPPAQQFDAGRAPGERAGVDEHREQRERQNDGVVRLAANRQHQRVAENGDDGERHENAERRRGAETQVENAGGFEQRDDEECVGDGFEIGGGDREQAAKGNEAGGADRLRETERIAACERESGKQGRLQQQHAEHFPSSWHGIGEPDRHDGQRGERGDEMQADEEGMARALAGGDSGMDERRDPIFN